jgi:hypothetical protein
MAATTFTSIVMVAFAVVVLTMASYAWLGDWEPQPRRRPARADEVDVEEAVAQMRQAIVEYERREQSR